MDKTITGKIVHCNKKFWQGFMTGIGRDPCQSLL